MKSSNYPFLSIIDLTYYHCLLSVAALNHLFKNLIYNAKPVKPVILKYTNLTYLFNFIHY